MTQTVEGKCPTCEAYERDGWILSPKGMLGVCKHPWHAAPATSPEPRQDSQGRYLIGDDPVDAVAVLSGPTSPGGEPNWRSFGGIAMTRPTETGALTCTCGAGAKVFAAHGITCKWVKWYVSRIQREVPKAAPLPDVEPGNALTLVMSAFITGKIGARQALEAAYELGIASQDQRVRELERQRDEYQQAFRANSEELRERNNELQAAWDELKKHLHMNPPETVLGGIRNLAQVVATVEDAAERAETAERRLTEAQEALDEWKRQALALTTLLRATCNEEEWRAMEAAFESALRETERKKEPGMYYDKDGWYPPS